MTTTPDFDAKHKAYRRLIEAYLDTGTAHLAMVDLMSHEVSKRHHRTMAELAFKRAEEVEASLKIWIEKKFNV